MTIDINKIPPVLDMVINDPKFPTLSGTIYDYKYPNVSSTYPIINEMSSTFKKYSGMKKWHITFHIDDKESPKLLETLDILKQLGLKVNKFKDRLFATKEIDVFNDSDVVGVPPNELPYVVHRTIESITLMFFNFNLLPPRISRRYEEVHTPNIIGVDMSPPLVSGSFDISAIFDAKINMQNNYDWSKVYDKF